MIMCFFNKKRESKKQELKRFKKPYLKIKGSQQIGWEILAVWLKRSRDALQERRGGTKSKVGVTLLINELGAKMASSAHSKNCDCINKFYLFQFLKRAEYFGKEKHGDDLLVFKILNSILIIYLFSFLKIN